MATTKPHFSLFIMSKPSGGFYMHFQASSHRDLWVSAALFPGGVWLRRYSG